MFDGNKFMIKFILIMLVICTTLGRAFTSKFIEKHYNVVKDKFAIIKVNTSALLGDSQQETCHGKRHIMFPELTRFTYLLAPTSEADLNDNWNYIIEDSMKLLLIYGFPLEQDPMSLELIQIDHLCSKLSRGYLIIHFVNELNATKQNSSLIVGTNHYHRHHGSDGYHFSYNEHEVLNENQGLKMHEEKTKSFREVSGLGFDQEVEFTLHGAELTKFLINNYPNKLETLFSETLWPGSRLMAVKRDVQNNGISVKFCGSSTVKTHDLRNGYMGRMELEILRAFPQNGYKLKKLCDYKHSKTISVEHFFRSMGLYPNWCTFRVSNRAL